MLFIIPIRHCHVISWRDRFIWFSFF